MLFIDENNEEKMTERLVQFRLSVAIQLTHTRPTWIADSSLNTFVQFIQWKSWSLVLEDERTKLFHENKLKTINLPLRTCNVIT